MFLASQSMERGFDNIVPLRIEGVILCEILGESASVASARYGAKKKPEGNGRKMRNSRNDDLFLLLLPPVPSSSTYWRQKKSCTLQLSL